MKLNETNREIAGLISYRYRLLSEYATYPLGNSSQLVVDLLAADGWNGNLELNLRMLLDFPDDKFLHDVIGIKTNINRETGRLGNRFIPFCVARKKKKKSKPFDPSKFYGGKYFVEINGHSAFKVKHIATRGKGCFLFQINDSPIGAMWIRPRRVNGGVPAYWTEIQYCDSFLKHGYFRQPDKDDKPQPVGVPKVVYKGYTSILEMSKIEACISLRESTFMTEEQKQNLEQQLWKIANELRGKMGADEFRDYILGFIFYKYLSEKQHIYANKLLETEAIKDYTDVRDEEDIAAIRDESLEKLGYFLRPIELFEAITERGNADLKSESNFILEDLQAILNGIEQSTMGTESEDDFNQLFEDLDLNSSKLGRTVEARNTLIAKVLSHLNKIDFALEDADSDVLGDAYEYLIAQFASGAGKKAGEFYTPQQVSKILAKLVTLDKKRIKSAYDPACGSGSLLLRISREAEVGEFFGQELNRTTYNLARMNMILHDVHYTKFDIKQEDTLEHPQHLDHSFDVVVANPPFSAKWKGKDNPLNETDDRFSQYGALAPTTKADFAFVQHMIYQLNDSGTMAVVLPHGVLFRGAAEGKIREYIIKEQNYLDAVIGLPANLFYGTSIPACILVFKKCRVHDDNILFIDASQHFDKVGNQNALSNDHVAKIIGSYQARKTIDKYAYVAPLSEVAENDYNLNIPRYVDTFEEEEPVDIEAVAAELQALESDMAETDATIAGFCKELGIPSPF